MIRTAAAAAVLTALTVAGCSAAGTPATDQPLPSGPLQRANPHGWAVERDPGAVLTDGLEVLHLAGDDDAVLTSVDLVGADGLEMLGAMLVTPDRTGGALQTISSWPPVDPELDPATVVPAVGTTITTDQEDPTGWELLVGMRVDSGADYASRIAVRVGYRVAERDYQLVIPAAVAVCTSAAALERDGSCPLPKGWHGTAE